ncbi:uncharacterized protein B0T15DRAFT_269735 [Chaetomium strumarium]|uniref:Uncharacterized protein n=1 Tax=Chaetomium strumarium TaxID=1170767 RepID=A0AAJ0GNN7_9PEZI|nr:hypothetical protein B0T15DRAFT_269735 [Chaetomium strumarium]
MPFLKPALLLHLIIETPASLSFLLAPTAQLPGASPEARLILRNFGGLHLATNLLCLVFLLRKPTAAGNDGGDMEQLTAMSCVCLATYHVWPLYRAWARMTGYGGINVGRKQKKVLGGPAVHLVVHVACLAALLGGGLVTLMGH